MAEKDEKEAAKVKVERVQFHVNFYESGVAKYESGKHYPKTPETESQVVANNAKIVKVEVDQAEHDAEHTAAHAALKHSRRATIAAEDDARKRGQLE
jgi:hypothetical protein